ncbi:hypothetical protein CHCC15292_3028 [Bacillus licheniformis]|nr:hypothetical protein CHCC16874_2803 [Bacillus licheniformis]TWL92727.1 hypothetical protein CHCC15292_3028 [Bacillus licheniformis]
MSREKAAFSFHAEMVDFGANAVFANKKRKDMSFLSDR